MSIICCKLSQCNITPILYSVFPLSTGGTQILKISQRGEPKKKFGVGKPKGEGEVLRKKGRTQFFKLNLGIENDKRDF